MSVLGPDRFAEFFAAVHGAGKSPFPWQRRLAERAATAEPGTDAWPEVLALPTASGKTAAIDIALFALACQADRPAGRRTAPRRVFFAVDRRVIVDEAFEHACKLADALRKAETGILHEVAAGLRRLAGGEDLLPLDHDPLACFELRGGLYRDDAWARTPTQPTVVTSTVDQLGSRLLFRGYGRSYKTWAVHAGLAANDSLLILDEAHCANPFRQTLQAVRCYRGREWAEREVPSPFWFVEMTATPRGEVPAEGLHDDDLSDPVLGKRLRAGKPVRLEDPVPRRKLVRSLCEKAEALAAGGAKRIGVIVNRVATAREVHDLLEKPADGKVLLTGRMRPLDRDDVMRRWRPYLQATDDREKRAEPVFVVATQCLEVGANLDFDALVSECASLDALRQRFGRLNRLGNDPSARGALVVADADLKAGAEDFVYGSALRETWNWLGDQAASGTDDCAVDFGIALFNRGWDAAVATDGELPKRLSPPAPDAPVLLPAHVDRWVQTAPVPEPDADLTLFLHGADHGAEVQVCWRADLGTGNANPEATKRRWIETLTLCRPSAAECMPVPLRVVRDWLAGVDDAAAAEVADVVGAAPDEGHADQSRVSARDQEPGRQVLRWRGPEDSDLLLGNDRRRLRPGDTLVLPAAEPSWRVFGHVPGADEADDLAIDQGDRARLEARRRAVLRIHPETVKDWPEDARSRLLDLARQPDLPDRIGTAELAEEIQDILLDLEDAADAATHPWLRLAAGHLARTKWRQLRVRLHPDGWDADSDRLRRRDGQPVGGMILTAPGLVEDEGEAGAGATEATATARVRTAAGDSFPDDDTASHAPSAIRLVDHCRRVAERARRSALLCDLPEAFQADLHLAGILHDLGKADPRFQAWLHGGNDLAARAAGLLAKSPGLPQSPRELDRARKRARYPRGGRHELLSVRLVENEPSLLAAAHDPDLVLHLIAAHHGHCRPFAPSIEDESPIEVTAAHDGTALRAPSATGLERLDSGVAERFWRLARRYGWWGLAYLEAIFVLADHRQSEADESGAAESESTERRKKEVSA